MLSIVKSHGLDAIAWLDVEEQSKRSTNLHGARKVVNEQNELSISMRKGL